jgi:hypothetical protein
MNETELINRCREIIPCDTARISKPLGTMYLIIGFNRNTKNNHGQWIKDGKPIDFDYVEEHVVASGNTEEELISSCEKYAGLSVVSLGEYLTRIIASKEEKSDE